LEATGVYSLRLALALQRTERVEVMVINPRASKDFQRARLTRAKTDRVDARGLLEYLRTSSSVRSRASARRRSSGWSGRIFCGSAATSRSRPRRPRRKRAASCRC
jgi:transposase